MFSHRTSLFVGVALATLGGCRAGHGDPPETDSETSTGTMSDTTDTMTMTTVGPTTEPSETSTVPDCGNGIREGDEQCDDGNKINTDECLDTCEMASCGDGHVYAGDEDGEGAEACDDGNELENDACDNSCEKPVCGDGVAEGDEECDIGEMNADDGECTSQCINAVCGDGFVHAGVEFCDKGDDNSDDYNADCNNSCEKGAFCGDAIVQSEYEECEGEDKCTDCFADRVVFLTSGQMTGGMTSSGSLKSTLEEILNGGKIGVAAADALCQKLAENLQPVVPGTFLAWIGDDDTQPDARFGLSGFSGKFTLYNTGETIATGWGDLTDGSLDHIIDVDETGASVENSFRVWTGLDSEFGQSEFNCLNWTSESSDYEGISGLANKSDAGWSYTNKKDCDNEYRLYCFQTSLD